MSMTWWPSPCGRFAPAPPASRPCRRTILASPAAGAASAIVSAFLEGPVMKRILFCALAAMFSAPAWSQAPAAQPPAGQPDDEFVADVTGAEDSGFSVAGPVFAAPRPAAR